MKAHRPVPPFLRRSTLWAALSMALAGGAQALTLGSPQVQSKLGEPLKAEINITQLTADEEQGLQVDFAEAEIYRSLQMELPGGNARPLDLRVQLAKRDNGQYVLRLSSQLPVNRRDLDLLLRMRWSTGQMLRNVPISMNDGSGAKGILTTPIAPSAPASNSTSNASAAANASANASATAATAETAKPASPKAVAAASALPVAKPKKAEDKDAGAGKDKSGGKVEVQRGDTASEIVAKRMPSGVSLDQMLVALLRSNPDAFVDNNVNRLKAGALLTLPSAGDAKELSREDAREEILFQTQNFNAYRAELAANAGRGDIAKAERSSQGKLQAQVQNKANKAQQYKLTLSKPKASKEEEQIAQQRQAQEVAQRAAELSRNVNELGKLANEVAGAPGEGVNLPSPPAPSESTDWIQELTQNPLAPVGAGTLIALMVVLGLLRRYRRQHDDDDIQGLPPLNVKFDLDLPDHPENTARAHSDDASHTDHAGHSGHGSHANHDGYDAQDDHEGSHPSASSGDRPMMAMPDISLDLNSASNHPLQVRMDLAEELWKLGQLHTSRALMEEVAQEASGEVQAKALQWLAERS
jgi:FimV-like protein